ncbi:hypothetical protein VTN96DRAFT_8580 [Rasamsonia emersonii]|uniref:Protein kinase domain-containing protein n=1 Tax=Rasamsonia emersonii (strain ATCC 16479 / CBS 393.64 / IMI 116815) TaxID=1408163 RepID=A0A0F4YL77_RASE3|nr:Uncharacterized protein T310_7070 [Rasamsonia emersonii CBS 393.64]KKA18984.1 Uncharacterized protein T310_7070 [Rasamsonia emersonii CBS 393.64]
MAQAAQRPSALTFPALPPAPPAYTLDYHVYGHNIFVLATMCYGKRFILYVAGVDLRELSDIWLNFMKNLMNTRAAVEEGRNMSHATLLDMWLLSNAKATMQGMASTAPWSRILTMEDWLNVDTVLLQMRISRGEMSLVPSTPSAGFFRARMPRLVLPFSDFLARSGVMLVHPSLIFLPPHDLSDRPPRLTKVFVCGLPRYFKPVPAKHGSEGMMRELEILLHIQRASASNMFRVPIVHEAVRAGEDDGQIYGLLLTYFPRSRTLARVRLQERPMALRLHWATQLREMVLKLHTAGIIWGSPQPESVLVDETNNLWIIEFGRTHAPRWVDRSKEGTYEGDLQGVAQMCNWLSGVLNDNTPHTDAADAGAQILATDYEIMTWKNQLAASGH